MLDHEGKPTLALFPVLINILILAAIVLTLTSALSHLHTFLQNWPTNDELVFSGLARTIRLASPSNSYELNRQLVAAEGELHHGFKDS
jgi:hypothetical protein